MKAYVYTFVLLLFFAGAGVPACTPLPIPEESGTEQSAETASERLTDAKIPEEPNATDATDAGPEKTTVDAPDAREPHEKSEPTTDASREQLPEPQPETSGLNCQQGEACNALLTPQGICPGNCLAQKKKVTCRGTVKHGLCYFKAPKVENLDGKIGTLSIKPGKVPELVKEGDSVDLEVNVTNVSTQAKTVAFSYQVYNHWQLIDASFKNAKTLDFKANETKRLTMKVKAIKADIFITNSLSRRQIIALSFDGEPHSLLSTVGYGPTGNVACGNHFFPARYCPSTTGCSRDRSHYFQGKCCDGVFYPGANCCQASDCPDGGCYDGRCSAARPTGLANTISRGHHKVLIVLSDVLDIPSDPKQVCTNRYNSLKKRLKLDEFEAYFKELSQQYTKRDGPAFQWTILAGINTADFNAKGGRDSLSMHNALHAHLIAKGCYKSIDDFDKRLLISSMADLGPFTGKANPGGRLTMKKIDMYLFAHELAHTYGATDLYLNLGGKLQYLQDLMGNNLGQFGKPTLGVAWGEMLWGDGNENGVIDVFEFAAHPEELVIKGLKAQLTAKQSLEITADIMAKEDGKEKRIFLKTMKIELPDFKASATIRPGDTFAFDGRQVDLDAIRAKGSVKIRISASYLFTQKDFTRVTRTLDESKDLKLAP